MKPRASCAAQRPVSGGPSPGPLSPFFPIPSPTPFFSSYFMTLSTGRGVKVPHLQFWLHRLSSLLCPPHSEAEVLLLNKLKLLALVALSAPAALFKDDAAFSALRLCSYRAAPVEGQTAFMPSAPPPAVSPPQSFLHTLSGQLTSL